MRNARLAVTAIALTAGLAVASPASAETEQTGRVDLPTSAKVVNAPAKRLSLKAAKKHRATVRRTHRFPAPPQLKVDRSQLDRVGDEAAAAPTPATEKSTLGASDRLFGNENAYAYKRDPILGAIQNYNRLNVPRNGGTYVAPRLYEVPNGGSLPGCNVAIYNGVYCPGVNSIGWSLGWTADAFRLSGDNRWATLIAHEYGHSAQNFLGIRGGWLGYTLYSEGFADCMAGGFLYYAYANHLTDSVGRGDFNEFRDAFVALQSPTTQLNNHGTFAWRYALATYGWNNGFDGCTRWARSIDGV